MLYLIRFRVTSTILTHGISDCQPFDGETLMVGFPSTMTEETRRNTSPPFSIGDDDMANHSKMGIRTAPPNRVSTELLLVY